MSFHRDGLRIEVRRQRCEDPPCGRHDSRHINRGIARADTQQRAEITYPIGIRAVERGGEDHDTTCCALVAEIERPAIDTNDSQSHARTEVGVEVTDALVEAGDLRWGERLGVEMITDAKMQLRGECFTDGDFVDRVRICRPALDDSWTVYFAAERGIHRRDLREIRRTRKVE